MHKMQKLQQMVDEKDAQIKQKDAQIKQMQSGGSSSSAFAQAQHLENVSESDFSTLEAQGEFGKVCGELGALSGGAGGQAGAELGRSSSEFGLVPESQKKHQQRNAEIGRQCGHLGSEAGKAAGTFGSLGGRPKTQNQVSQAVKSLSKELQPQRREDKAASVARFRKFCIAQLKKHGLEEHHMDIHFMAQHIRTPFFEKRRTRDLMRLWQSQEKADRVKTLELGAGGASRKKGEHSVLRQHLGLGIRAINNEEGNRKSALWFIFGQVQKQFHQWRLAGQYVDKNDIAAEFDYRLHQRIDHFEKKIAETGELNTAQAKEYHYALRRKASHEKGPKGRESTLNQMMRLFRCRFLKPQRLIHLSLEQEKLRLLESWQYWDFSIWLACFAPLEQLGQHVVNSQQYRDNVRATVIAMSDQMPFWIKLRPGKQLYLPGEFAPSKQQKKVIEASEKGGGNQKQESFITENKPGVIDREGMTQTRGSSHCEQDKFRITMDVEQVCYGFFDEDQDPKADWGITSVIFLGAHFRLSNVSKDRMWIEDDVYVNDGVQKICKAGQAIPPLLGSALLNFRDNCSELYEKMISLGFRFYQQPAGFEDSVITAWKIKEQAKVHGQTLALRDLFGGALSESSRETMFLLQQLSAWIRAKITAMAQVADTHVIRPVKVRKLQKDINLRRELIRLAEIEDTPAIFKCGMYEIMRTLYEVVTELKEEWKESQYLLRAMYQNGWLSLRPSLKSGHLVRTDQQPWTQGMRFGSHRILDSWTQQRFDHLDENSVPQATPLTIDKTGETDDAEQTYMVEPGEKRSLKVWQKMLDEGNINPKELKEFEEEPWFEVEVDNFDGIEGLNDEYHTFV